MTELIRNCGGRQYTTNSREPTVAYPNLFALALNQVAGVYKPVGLAFGIDRQWIMSATLTTRVAERHGRQTFCSVDTMGDSSVGLGEESTVGRFLGVWA